MSIKLLSAAWDLDIDSTEKMVLMCLCDYADDEGRCWPSVATIGRKCSKSERTVQSALKWLNDNGFFSFTDKPGKGRLYRLNPRRICTPAESAPAQETTVTPAEFAPHPRKSRTQTTNEPPITTNVEPIGSTARARPKPVQADPVVAEPPPERARRTQRSEPAVEIPDWMPAAEWSAFLDMRKLKGAPPTARAVSLLVGKIEALKSRGHDPSAVLDQSTLKSWTDVYEIKDWQNGTGNHQTLRPGGQQGPDQRSALARVIDDAIDRIDGFG